MPYKKWDNTLEHPLPIPTAASRSPLVVHFDALQASESHAGPSPKADPMKFIFSLRAAEGSYE